LLAIVATLHHLFADQGKRDGHSDATLQQSIDRIGTAFSLPLLPHTARYWLAPAYLKSCGRNTHCFAVRDIATITEGPVARID